MSYPSLAEQKRWSDRFRPQLQAILGGLYFRDASFDDDTKRNTDLLCAIDGATRIACRVRQVSYMATYGDQVTIRSRSAGGKETEIDKVLAGWGDVFLYAFADGERIVRWSAGDLQAFRRWYLGLQKHGLRPGISKRNGDGTELLAFKLPGSVGYGHEVLPADYLIAKGP